MTLDPRILLSEISFKTSRSGGKGGQNVNKVSSKVELNFNISLSKLLNEEQKNLLISRLHKKISQDGVLQVFAQEERSQLGNKEVAINKFISIIERGLFIAKGRKATKASKSSKEKRLKGKKQRSEVKRLRKIDF